MQIVDFPTDERESAFAIVRRNYEESLRRYGVDDAQGRAWLELQMLYIRDLVSEIKNSGGGAGGRA
jgi:hypothetical protein